MVARMAGTLANRNAGSCNARVQRADRNLFEQQTERARRDSSAPMLARDPVTDGILTVQLETVDVAYDTPVHDDRFCHDAWVTENARPVLVEGAFIAWVRDRHASP